MNINSTLSYYALLCLLFLSAPDVSGQDSKFNAGNGSQTMSISLVASEEPAFPQLGDLQASEAQINFYGKKLSKWIATHEFTFKNMMTNCGECSRISTSFASKYGEAGILRLKEIINKLGPALKMEMQGHESLYPAIQSGNVPSGPMVFIISKHDFETLEKAITQ
jgi:hypothetical protein